LVVVDAVVAKEAAFEVSAEVDELGTSAGFCGDGKAERAFEKSKEIGSLEAEFVVGGAVDAVTAGEDVWTTDGFDAGLALSALGSAAETTWGRPRRLTFGATIGLAYEDDCAFTM
jgi:hypothetical protein